MAAAPTDEGADVAGQGDDDQSSDDAPLSTLAAIGADDWPLAEESDNDDGPIRELVEDSDEDEEDHVDFKLYDSIRAATSEDHEQSVSAAQADSELELPAAPADLNTRVGAAAEEAAVLEPRVGEAAGGAAG